LNDYHIQDYLQTFPGQVGVETFLYSYVDEAIWIKLLEGYSVFLKEVHGMFIEQGLCCDTLLNTIFGLILAGKQRWKRLISPMAKLGYDPSLADPFPFMRKELENQLLTLFMLTMQVLVGRRKTYHRSVSLNLLDRLGILLIVRLLRTPRRIPSGYINQR
jgi:hypothetical protein